MNINVLKDGVVFFFTRIMIIFLGIFILGYFTFDYKLTSDKAKVQVLNRLMPSYTDLIDANAQSKKIDQKSWKGSLHYYNMILEYVPNLSEANLFSSYCYYQLGDNNQAINSLEKLVGKNPNIFWAYFNLGVLYLKENQLDKSINSFKKALDVRPELFVVLIASSKIYVPFVQFDSKFSDRAHINLKNGYMDALKLVVYLTSKVENNKESEISLPDELNKLNLRLY